MVGRPRILSKYKTKRTSITLTRETHNSVISRKLNVSAICEAALVKRIRKSIPLSEVQAKIIGSLNKLEDEVELSDTQKLSVAQIKKMLYSLKGDAYIEVEE